MDHAVAQIKQTIAWITVVTMKIQNEKNLRKLCINILCVKITFDCQPLFLNDCLMCKQMNGFWYVWCLPNNPAKSLVYLIPDMTYVNNKLSDISSQNLWQNYTYYFTGWTSKIGSNCASNRVRIHAWRNSASACLYIHNMIALDN